MSIKKDSKQLTLSISCHAWNKDGTQVAICPNNTEIHVYKKTGAKWECTHILTEHDQLVTSMDWAPETNRIVSCSQDRNAYVWTYVEETDSWKPTLVILRINRAATHVKWSPKEDKFAVASGARVVSVCYFEEVNDWWVSKHIKRHRSTILSVAWHPSNLLLATGCSDFKTRIFSAAIKGVDKKAPTPFGEKPAPFGEQLAIFDAGTGWVHSVAWSPNGVGLAFVCHDSSICFVNDITGTDVQKIEISELPFKQVAFVGEGKVVAAGWECNPFIFMSDANGVWSSGGKVDREAKKEEKAVSGTSAAFKMFQAKTSRGEESSGGTKLQTEHQNAITCLTTIPTIGEVTHVSTTGADGKIVVWEVKSLESLFAEMRV